MMAAATERSGWGRSAARDPLPPRPRHALLEERRPGAGTERASNPQREVPRDGHALLALAGRGRASAGSELGCFAALRGGGGESTPPGQCATLQGWVLQQVAASTGLFVFECCSVAVVP